MLALTRELVSRLNQRAWNHRLASASPGREVGLGDGSRASVGDLIITRANDRRLRITATDWVKNGDRWVVLNLTGGGGVRVRHVRNGRTATLPAGYVSTATELGYASTVHIAQGVTADTVHGVVAGEQSRQQLYTMLTRGRTANHVYVSVVGGGDPHTLIRPDTILPSTATELLEQILAGDGSPRSASTLLRDQQDPAVRLGESVARYLDALHMAAEYVIASSAVQAVETSASRLLPGLSDEPANAGRADRRPCRYGAPPPRSTSATCDPPGHPNSATPPESSNSNSTSGSPQPPPVQNGDGGNYSPQKFPVRPRTHSCRS